MGFFNKLFGRQEKESLYQGLKKTREGFISKLVGVLTGKTTIDEELLNELEEVLLGSDVGVETTVRILERIEKQAAHRKFTDEKELHVFIQQEIEQILVSNRNTEFYDFKSELPKRPYIILVVGNFNGVGHIMLLQQRLYSQGLKQDLRVLRLVPNFVIIPSGVFELVEEYRRWSK